MFCSDEGAYVRGNTLGGWIGYLIAGFIGACILIAVARAFSGAFQRT
jgi:uncharacterized membrane protein YeaQ/YmgE (transglycosylase-associated protein family)